MSATLPYVATGVANTASVVAAFRRLGRELAPATRDDVCSAPALVLPGVGHFGAAVQRLEQDGLFAALRERLSEGRATLGICLGMQLCCDGSDEAPGTAGLGAVPGRCSRFPSDVRVPQMGWNLVEAPAGARVLQTGYAYFANSFALHSEQPAQDAGYLVGSAQHGCGFVAAVERGPVVLCQFHPELSGAYGSALLQRWLDAAASPAEEAAC